MPALDLSSGSASSWRTWPRSVRLLLLGTMLSRATTFAYGFLAYLVTFRGHGAGATGWVLAAFGGGWLAGQAVTGWAADVFGPRVTLLVGMLLGTGALLELSCTQSVAGLVVGAVGAGIASDAPRPVVGVVVARDVPDDAGRAAAAAWRHGAQNIGAALTGAVGGLVADRIGLVPLFVVNALGCVAFAVLAVVALPGGRPPAATFGTGGYRRALSDPALRLLLVPSLGGLVCVLAMTGALPLVMSSEGLSAGDYGWVQVCNSVTVVLLTWMTAPWLSRRAGRARPMVGVLAGSALLLGLALAAAILARTVPGIALAVAVSIPGEIALMVSAGDILTRIAPPALRGRYQGVWGMTLAAAGVLSPLLVSAALQHGGRGAAAGVLAVAGAGGAAACLPLARSLHRLAAADPRPPVAMSRSTQEKV